MIDAEQLGRLSAPFICALIGYSIYKYQSDKAKKEKNKCIHCGKVIAKGKDSCKKCNDKINRFLKK